MHFLIDEYRNPVQVAPKWDDSMRGNPNWIGRHDIVSLDHAKKLAAAAYALTGKLHMGIDNGECVWPRYDVIEAPVIGDEVSYAFNGDYYPCGTITKISASMRRVETSTGTVFYRRKLSGRWVYNGTWSMVHGHISKLNPSF